MMRDSSSAGGDHWVGRRIYMRRSTKRCRTIRFGFGWYSVVVRVRANKPHGPGQVASIKRKTKNRQIKRPTTSADRSRVMARHKQPCIHSAATH
jgi:hypothetical protein